MKKKAGREIETRLANAAALAERRRRIDKLLGLRLVLLVNLMTQPFYNNYGKGFQISQNEWRILLALGSNPGISVSELCYFSGLLKMNVTRGLKILEKQRRVEISEDPTDGRRRILHLTSDGEAVLEGMLVTAENANKELWSHLSASEQRLLREMLDRSIEVARVISQREREPELRKRGYNSARVAR